MKEEKPACDLAKCPLVPKLDNLCSTMERLIDKIDLNMALSANAVPLKIVVLLIVIIFASQNAGGLITKLFAAW